MCPGTSPGPADAAGARQCASACFGGPLCPHSAVARSPSGSRATCVYGSWPVGLYNSGNASRGLLAGHGAGIMNHSPWVGQVGPGSTGTVTACTQQ